MKIYFDLSGVLNSNCDTPCPNLDMYVGSTSCQECEYLKSINWKDQFVMCRYDEREPHESLRETMYKTYTIVCHKCKRTYDSGFTSHDSDSKALMASKYFYNMGWRVSKDNDRAICNDCQGEDFED